MDANQTNGNWLTCGTTNARLASVNDTLTEILDPSDKEFNEIIFQLIRMGGKRIRPSLFLLSATFGDNYDKSFLHPAAALELIHVASLYHDDVMDRAEQRRKIPSANSLWGNSNATSAGNYLFSKAISMLAESGEKINQITCHYISELCLGQLKEAENAYDVNFKKEDHLDIINKKTGSLFELPCILGATLSGADPEIIEALVMYSKETGLAFQLMDDLLDLTGDPVKTGKSKGTDLKEGIYSYATLHALSSAPCRDQLCKILLLENLDAEKINEAIEIIIESGGISEAKNKAGSHLDKAVNAIAILPQTEAKTTLINLARFVFYRDH